MSEISRSPGVDVIFNMLKEFSKHDRLLSECVFGEDWEDLFTGNLRSFARKMDKPNISLNWAGNLLTLAGAFLYAKFNVWRGSYDNSKDLPNTLYLKRLLRGFLVADEFYKPSAALRILRVLDGLFEVFDLNFMVIRYIIINSQIEAGMSDDRKKPGLSKLLGFPRENTFKLVCDIDDDEDDDYDETGYNLVEAFNYISTCRNDANILDTYDEMYPPSKIRCILFDVFSTLEFFKRIKLVIEDGNVDFIELSKKGAENKIHSRGVVKAFLYDTEDNTYKEYMHDSNISPAFFMLESIDCISLNTTCELAYRSFDERVSVIVHVSENKIEQQDDRALIHIHTRSAADHYKNITGYLPGTHTKSFFFGGLITAHYRYHSVFAPAIVDAIDDKMDSKIQLLQRFVKKDRHTYEETLKPVFKTLRVMGRLSNDGYERDDNDEARWKRGIDAICDFVKRFGENKQRLIDWDSLIARIMMYDGPTELIKVIFARDKSRVKIATWKTIEEIFTDIVTGIDMRYSRSNFGDKNESFSKTVLKRQRRIFSNLESNIKHQKRNIPQQLYSELECKILIESFSEAVIKTLTESEEDSSSEINPQFVENSINDKMDLFSRLESTVNDKQIAESAFVQTVVSYLAFYAGVHGCCHSRVIYEFEKGSKILHSEISCNHQRRIEDAFFKGVSNELVRLSNSIGDSDQIDAALKELWNFAIKSSPEASAIHRSCNAVFNRGPIDAARISKVFLVEQSGNIKFFDPSGKVKPFYHKFVKKNENIPVYIKCLNEIICILAGENADHEYSANYKDLVKKVVYPQVVTFSKRHEDRDANDFLIMDHNNAFSSVFDGRVHILTEFKYQMNYAYYALPNVNRAEREWWIDPFLISCYEFDKEVRDAVSVADDK